MSSTPAPANAAMTDEVGRLTQAWQAFFRKVGQDVSDIGDYKLSARPDLGGGWLLCDGNPVAQTDYPDLYKRIGAITGPGPGPGTFRIPSIAAVYDAEFGGSPVGQWWIKAR